MALYFYFNETTDDLVYSDKATYDVEGYTSLGEQTNMNPSANSNWVFDSQRSAIVTVSKDESVVGKIAGLTSMSNMFNSCSNLISLDLSGFDTSAVTNMGNMFYRCRDLISLDLSGLDTSAVTNMGSMFYSCTSLTSLDLSGFDTSAVVGVENMFRNCNSLTSLDLSGFDTSAVTNILDKSGMFTDCNSLRLITISPMMSEVLSELPADQYYPAAGGAPVAKADLTAGTWVRDEADLTKVTSIVQQAQMQQAISRRIGDLRRDLEVQIKEASALLEQLDFASGGFIPVENGGTGATTAAQARTNLGAASESDLDDVRDSLSRLSTATPSRISASVTPGGSYTVPSDGVYVLTSISKSPNKENAWWLKDGIEFFGINNGEVCIPLWLKKGAKLTTRSGEDLYYSVRSVF